MGNDIFYGRTISRVREMAKNLFDGNSAYWIVEKMFLKKGSKGRKHVIKIINTV